MSRYKPLKATITREDLANSKRGRREIRQMRQGFNSSSGDDVSSAVE